MAQLIQISRYVGGETGWETDDIPAHDATPAQIRTFLTDLWAELDYELYVAQRYARNARSFLRMRATIMRRIRRETRTLYEILSRKESM